jgi:hypothetical protein
MGFRNYIGLDDTGGGKVALKAPTLTPQQRAAQSTYSAPGSMSFASAGPAPAIAPAQNYSPTSNPYRSAPIPVTQPVPQGIPAQQGNSMGGGGGAISAPRSPMSYSQFTDDQAATDSIFMDQKSQYANALKKFIEDNDRQAGILDTDANTAQQGIARNRTNGLTGLSEDFASRGLSNSGMFATELGNADKQYDNQKTQVLTGLKNGKDDLSFRRAKYEQENGENGSNIQAARREAFARLAASQGLT